MRYKVETSTNPEKNYIIIQKSLDINKCNKAYNAGYSLVEATHVCEKLNKHPRANIEQRDVGLHICWGVHEKNEACDYELVISYMKDSNDLYDQCRELGYLGLTPYQNTEETVDEAITRKTGYSTIDGCKNQPDKNGLWPGGGGIFVQDPINKPLYVNEDGTVVGRQSDVEKDVAKAVAKHEKNPFVGTNDKLARLKLDEAGQWEFGTDPYGFKTDAPAGKVEVITGSAGELEKGFTQDLQAAFYSPSKPIFDKFPEHLGFRNPEKLLRLDPSTFYDQRAVLEEAQRLLKIDLKPEHKSLIHVELPRGGKTAEETVLLSLLHRAFQRISILEEDISIIKLNQRLNEHDKAKAS